MRLVVAALSAVALLSSADAWAKPWKPRHPSVTPLAAHQLRSPSFWPAEPPGPETLDQDRFLESVAYLCRMSRDEAPGPEILAAAREAGVEPFLLAGLVYHQSRCRAGFTARRGYGLLALHPALYRAPGSPRAPAHLKEWTRDKLLNARANLGLGARLLRMWQDAHVRIDEEFGGAPHRSPISHFVWGDVVRSSGVEDLVLTLRRRLLAHYNGESDAPRPSPLGLPVVVPLEGSPRVATSAPGADRDGGLRRHRGLDIVAVEGEPVRAMADGQVIFAGANVPGRPRKGGISPAVIGRYTRRRLGKGGIYLCIRHAPPRGAVDAAEPPPPEDLVSCYMHLETYTVAQGDMVKAGQTIGFVGRTGVKVSPPHLHLELRVQKRHTNPLRAFSDVLIPPKATMTYRYTTRAQRERLRAARAAAAAAATTSTAGL